MEHVESMPEEKIRRVFNYHSRGRRDTGRPHRGLKLHRPTA